MDKLFFRTLVTKDLRASSKADDERFFEGLLTVEMKDKQGEITIVDELYKVLPVWMDRGAPITDTHSNRVVGKGINFAKTTIDDAEGNTYPAIKITGKIHKDYELDDDIWKKIKDGTYKGLSFGGATKADREPVKMKDGSIAYALTDLEHYEVAVCEDPAVPLALITHTNPLSKAMVEHEDLGNGKMLIKCDKFGCYVTKQDFSNANGDQHSMYNQDVDVDTSSNRKLGVVRDKQRLDDSSGDGSGGFGNEANTSGIGEWQGSGHQQPKEVEQLDELPQQRDKDMGQGRTGGVRGLGGYNTAQQGSEPTTQITEVNDDKKTEKSEIYIKNDTFNKDNNMTDEDKKPEEEKKISQKAEDDKEEEKKTTRKAEDDKDEETKTKKAFEESVKAGLGELTEQVKNVAATIQGIDGRVKALETPTDLPLAPAGTTGSDNDVGADVTAPAKPYPQGDQAGLDDDRVDDNKPANDAAPSMQEKPLNKVSEPKLVTKSQHTFSTETPRPNAAIEKAGGSQTDFSPILNDARAEGFEGLSNVARNILKGKYYTPSDEEVRGF
jgi:hypothetical protein